MSIKTKRICFGGKCTIAPKGVRKNYASISDSLVQSGILSEGFLSQLPTWSKRTPGAFNMLSTKLRQVTSILARTFVMAARRPSRRIIMNIVSLISRFARGLISAHRIKGSSELELRTAEAEIKILVRAFTNYIFSTTFALMIHYLVDSGEVEALEQESLASEDGDLIDEGADLPANTRQYFRVIRQVLMRTGFMQAFADRTQLRFLAMYLAFVVSSSGATTGFSGVGSIRQILNGQTVYISFISELSDAIVDSLFEEMMSQAYGLAMRNKKHNKAFSTRKRFTDPLYRAYFEEEGSSEFDDLEQTIEEMEDMTLEEPREGSEEWHEEEEFGEYPDYEDEEYPEEYEDDYEDYEDEEYPEEYEDDYEDYDEYLEDDDVEYVSEDVSDLTPSELPLEDFEEEYVAIEPSEEAKAIVRRLINKRRMFSKSISAGGLVNDLLEYFSKYFSDEEQEKIEEESKVFIAKAEAAEVVESAKELAEKLAELLLQEKEEKEEAEGEEEESVEFDWGWEEEEEKGEEEEKSEDTESEEEGEEEESEEKKSASRKRRAFVTRGKLFSKRRRALGKEQVREWQSNISKIRKKLKPTPNYFKMKRAGFYSDTKRDHKEHDVEKRHRRHEVEKRRSGRKELARKKQQRRRR
jgi:hypothetical protein